MFPARCPDLTGAGPGLASEPESPEQTPTMHCQWPNRWLELPRGHGEVI